MRFCVLAGLMASAACCAMGFQIAPPPQLQTVVAPASVHKQFEEAIGDRLTAEATATISTTFFNHILADVDVLINKIAPNIVIPGMNEKHFEFSDVHFQQFNIGAITIRTAAPNVVVVDIADVTVIIPRTKFRVKIRRHLHCSGKFWATVENGNFEVTAVMGNTGTGHLTTQIAIQTTYGKLNVHHRMTHFFCRLANALLQLFIGNIDRKINRAIKNDVPRLLAPALTKALNTMFTKVPLYFVQAPAITHEGISVTVDLLAPIAVTAQNEEAFLERLDMDLEGFSKDVAISVPAKSMNNIMATAQANGKLKYHFRVAETTKIFALVHTAAYIACPDCALALDVNLPVAPSLSFAANAIDASVTRLDIAVGGVHPSTGAVVPLFTINVNATLDINHIQVRMQNGVSNLYFQLAMGNFDIAVGQSSVGPFPILNTIFKVLTHIVDDLALPAFNAAFQGVNFPHLMGGVHVTALDGVFHFETNILVPPIS